MFIFNFGRYCQILLSICWKKHTLLEWIKLHISPNDFQCWKNTFFFSPLQMILCFLDLGVNAFSTRKEKKKKRERHYLKQEFREICWVMIPLTHSRVYMSYCLIFLLEVKCSTGSGIGYLLQYSWIPSWPSWQRICLQCGRPEFHPWVGKIPWRRQRLPTPVFWPGEFHGLYSPWGCKELDTTELLSLHPTSFHSTD